MPDMMMSLFDPGALAVVVVGTLLATAVRCGWRAFGAALRTAAALGRPAFDKDANRRALAVALAMIQRDGAFRADPALPPDPALGAMLESFLRQGTIAALDKARDLQCGQQAARRTSAAQVFACAGELAPVFGLIGTLFGLAQLAPGGTAGSTATIMGAVSSAVLTSLYGALMAHLLCFPLAGAIERRGLAVEAARASLVDWFVEQIGRLSAHAHERRTHLRGVA
jgi:chemotaxis protein MotA